MAGTASVMISFKDLPADERVREEVEQRCRQLAEEFPETTRFEITLAPDGAGHTAHGRVTGKLIEVATHAEAMEIAQAAGQLLDRVQRQLRRVHDKRIFAPRREAQRSHPKRGR